MNMKKIYSFFILFFLSLNSRAQFDFVQKPVESRKANIQNSVNSFTGKLGLNIPFYSYQSSRSPIGMGVSLSYSGGGVTMQDRRSVVGTSWQLDAANYGITRVINDLPDDLTIPSSPGNNYVFKGYMYNPVIPDNPCLYLYRMPGKRIGWCHEDKNQMDGEADHFYYSLPGAGGMFVIPKNSTALGGSNQIKTIPQSNLKIKVTKFFPSSDVRHITSIAGFEITTENGVQYTFDAVEYSVSTRCIQFLSVSGVRACNNGCEVTSDAYTVFSWKLSKISDLNSPDQITFNYSSYLDNEDDGTTAQSYRDRTTNNVLDITYSNNTKELMSKRLTNIQFPGNTSVLFLYKTITDTDIVPEDKMLDKVEVNRGASRLTYRLNHEFVKNNSTVTPIVNESNNYSNVNTNNLIYPILSSVENYVNDNTRETVASFQYKSYSGQPFEQTIKSCFTNLGVYYCTGIPSGGYVTPSYVVPYTYQNTPAYPYENNNLTELSTHESRFAGVLERVNYPEGGYSVFEYEDNERYIPTTNSTVKPGGLRIAKVKQVEGIYVNTEIVKEYKYKTEAGASSGFGMPQAPYDYFNDMKTNGNIVKQYKVSTPLGVLPSVKLYGNTVGYKRVEEITSNGKIVHEFTSFDDFPPLVPDFTYPFAAKQKIADWAYGLPKVQAIYDPSGNLIKKTTNNYNVVITPSTSVNSRSMKTAYLTESETDFYGSGGTCNDAYVIWNGQKDIYNTVTGRVEVTSVINEERVVNGISQSIQEVSYDPDLLYPRKTTSYNSINEKIEQFQFYATDPGAGETDLNNKSLNATPVATITILTKADGNKYLVGYNRSRFQTTADGNKRLLKALSLRLGRPIQITENIDKYLDLFDFEQKYNLTARQDHAVTNDKFDYSGNVIQITNTKSNIKESIQYDASGSLITAKVQNAENDFKLEPLPSPNSTSVNLFMGPSNPSASGTTSFTLPFAGSIVLTAGGVPSSYSSNVNYELTGPSIKTGNLCASGIGINSCNGNPSTITFNNMPAGSYTLNASSSTSFTSYSFTLNVNCSFTGVRYIPKYTGTFLFDGFEEADKWDSQLTLRDNTKKRTGEFAGKIDKPDAGEKISHNTQWLNIPQTTARKFKYSGWIYSNGPSAELVLLMKRANETGYSSYVDQVYAPSTLNKWVYVEKELSIPADVTQLNIRIDNNGGGTVWFDDIRLHPSEAFMTTYTYNELGAVTSETDVNNQTIYYEYDLFNRLTIERDQDKNIIKKICYRYSAQSPENCVANYDPQWQSTGAVRCKPCPSNNNYITNMQQHEERDINVISGSYNTIRWVDDNVQGSCVANADWQNTTTQTRCQKNSNNQNTGYQEQEQKDINPCSPSYNTLRWIVTGQNTTLCPLPPACNTTNCTGINRKCVNGQCETGILVIESYYCTRTGACKMRYHYEFSDGNWSQTYTGNADQSNCNCSQQ
jgi:YD repeat-containing protein